MTALTEDSGSGDDEKVDDDDDDDEDGGGRQDGNENSKSSVPSFYSPWHLSYLKAFAAPEPVIDFHVHVEKLNI